MSQVRIGIRLEALNRPLRQAVTVAAGFGIPGVQLDAIGDLAPDQLSQTGRRALKHLLHSHNLELTAIGCPLRYALSVEQNAEGRIAHVKKVLNLAYDLGPRRAIVSPGAIPSDEGGTGRVLFMDALRQLGGHAERVGSTLALDAGLDPPDKLKALLEQLPAGGLGVNLDPATLLTRGHDPAEAVRVLHGLIVHAHARDARLVGADREAQDVPLGHGDIDWIAFLGALEEVGYHGWLTIKRAAGPDPAAEITDAIAFLRRLGG